MNAAKIIYLGLGSNLGKRSELLNCTIKKLTELWKFSQFRVSSFYETEPIGYLDQPWFLNAVIEITLDEPQLCTTILSQCFALEKQFGRTRLGLNAPRTIDIDFLLGWNKTSQPIIYNKTMSEMSLILPHPRLHLRRFVLQPLCEICPKKIHPTLNKSFQDILCQLQDNSIVEKWNK